MSSAHERRTAQGLRDVLDAALNHARDRGQEVSEQLTAFLRQYYRFVAEEDLADREPAALLEAARSHLEMAQQRTPGTALVRVLAPGLEDEQWYAPRAIVQVATDDMPFLVDTVSAELTRHDLRIRLVIHPVVTVRRDAIGRLVDVVPPDEAGPDLVRESFIHVELDRLPEGVEPGPLRNDVRRVLEDVRAAVEDWDKMAARLEEAAVEAPATDEGDEIRALAAWMLDKSFTFLGFREYSLSSEDGDAALCSVPGTGLGILRDAGFAPVSRSFAKLPAEVRRRALDPTLLTITKANSRATVHRPAYLDYVSVKRLGDEGRPIGERRFLGLFSATAYAASVTSVPVVRRKVQEVLDGSGFRPGSHDYKALLAVLEDHPRDELFQATSDELLTTALGILHLQERRQVRLFLRRDPYGRFVSCLIYLPRERYTTQNRLKVQDVLMEAFGGTSVEHTIRVSESVLSRLHVVVRTAEPVPADIDVHALEEQLESITRSWNDELAEALVDAVGDEAARSLQARYGEAFPEAYKEDFPARAAVPDVQRLEALRGSDDIDLNLYRPPGAAPGEYRFKVFRVGPPLSLSTVMPLLQDMGVEVSDERPYGVELPDGELAWVYDFGLRCPTETELEDRQRSAFEAAFAAAWRGQAESDPLNALVLAEALDWHEVVVLRTYAKYLRQVGTTFSESYIAQTLVRNSHVARQLVELFRSRFDPHHRGDDEESLLAELRTSLDAVASLDEDRILRSYIALVRATLRTTWFQRDEQGRPKEHLAVKLDPAKVPDLPLPRPAYEIFVYSPRVEGVHLRFGPVARGGLRWSDRREDFRTEVLGLVKAQMVKNAVIVPVGSKGGFVVKRPADPANREAWLAEGIACYTTFIHGMLDLTDNIVDGAVVPPADVFRHDGDDPYLVVAADKGTATFSDIANGVAIEHGFWLGDAFASGGSAGYDHKAMGITARGAWESVKRHFRELGLDTQTQPFTVVGVGDMSGDVFGNGMLLSEQIRLVAAFDHRHVFLDPDPDPATSYAERQRLFALPRSSWDDYDKTLISEGGGVFPRTAKSIPLSPQVQQALAVSEDAMTPAELMRAILLAPVDLLWNGGIGTYVKAAQESNAEVGDKANDAIRVNGTGLRCRVVGEGGNLGLTQAGRIEYALNGGRVNTDAIDNSAGVDCSDHEVNIKILLGQAVAAGELTLPQRDALLHEMTDEVAELVLRDNYEQNVALGNARAQAPEMLPVYRRYLAFLDKSGLVDRELEHLPDDKELESRAAAGGGLTSPEFAVVLAWTKIGLTKQILDSDVPEDPHLSHELERYFPRPLRERFSEQMGQHRLRREIIATVLVNKMVNRAGITFAHRMAEEVGVPAADIVRAHTVATDVFAMPGFWRDVEALDNVIPTEVQTRMLLKGRQLVERATRWLLTNRRPPLDIAATVRAFAPGAETVVAGLHELLGPAEARAMHEIAARYRAEGVPDALALRVAGFGAAYSALDVVEVAGATDRPVEEVAGVFFALDGVLELGLLRDHVLALPRTTRWQTLARAALRDDLNATQAALTGAVLMTTEEGEPEKRIDAWLELNAAAVARAAQVLEDIVAGEVYDVATLSVAMRQLRGLTQTSTAGEASRGARGAEGV
jgi:glutamate dehydrogenase